jgi:tellurite resistance protein
METGDGLLALSALTWAVVVIFYLRYALFQHRTVVADLLDHTAGPFASLALITPMLLAAEGIYPYAPTPGKAMVDSFLVATVALGGWFTGQWIYGPLQLDQMHPGYFLPTVAGGLVASACAADVGQHRLAEAMFGLGIICWIILGSIILARLLVRPALVTPLIPTLAIEVAPPAVASLAYFALDHDRLDTVAAALAGYGLLMVMAQLRLLPAYLRLQFMPSLWAFTFAWAAVVTSSLHWLHDAKPAGYRVYEYIILMIITLGIGVLAVRTALALFRKQLVPAQPVPPTAPADLSVPAAISSIDPVHQPVQQGGGHEGVAEEVAPLR